MRKAAQQEQAADRLTGTPETLHVEGLQVHYGGVQAVHGTTFDVAPGEAVGIIGANGAGKTSTLKAVLGLVARQGTSMRYGGTDLLRTPASRMVRLGIGYVPEGRHVFPGLSVEKNLFLGAYVRKWDAAIKEQAAEVYELFPVLGEMRSRLAGALSGGQQQMLAMGRALMSRPSLMVCDEPSMGLSPILVEDILSVLQRLHSTGLSILLVEQNARLCFEAVDRCLVMEHGQVVKTGQVEELRTDPDVRRIYLGI
ncbi:branched-chain amino acid transport system ATP-binding protein [Modestobacter sp. DSM 44400]|uniref:ABC transporter ATP-binding protein n=1 Tax=Modestobacter sp. DSM 44400 TaxID=1550230 RepID=UPI00089623AF|nr:ABC transporter ATP-binding protein [Modestobacter sp. DSM 44400]SDY78056.1 branched-chain amino acid transport system ATP-binding protein [Modestobacter sp. DSM 44400]